MYTYYIEYMEANNETLLETTYTNCDECGNDHLASEGYAEWESRSGKFTVIRFMCLPCADEIM